MIYKLKEVRTSEGHFRWYCVRCESGRWINGYPASMKWFHLRNSNKFFTRHDERITDNPPRVLRHFLQKYSWMFINPLSWRATPDGSQACDRMFVMPDHV